MTSAERRYAYTDLHAAGEPVRIVTGGAPVLSGATLLDKRRDAMQTHDAVRRHLMLEPRGHADMYGVWPTEPDRSDCALAVLFMHNGGWSTMCGHATVALGRWVIDQGIVQATRPLTSFRLQCPCGPVDVRVETDATGRTGRVSFDSVPAFAGQLSQPLQLNGHERIAVDIAYGGAYYAILPASRLGLDLYGSPFDELVAAGRSIIAAGREQLDIRHPGEADLGFLYGCIITDGSGPPDSLMTRNLCLFGDGQVDRSATGSGITARLALAHARGHLAPGVACEFAGLSGVPFAGEIREALTDDQVIVTVSGQGYYSGEGSLCVESKDPLRAGFEVPRRLADQAGRSTT
ncbi:proline racemase family protein [Spiribacter insolitus]|uniref:Proline racemase family protein n=1 Tax=Spiribacter insolitus TaxID=3122417 RepID=A0ABV3T7W1_9GAMM